MEKRQGFVGVNLRKDEQIKFIEELLTIENGTDKIVDLKALLEEIAANECKSVMRAIMLTVMSFFRTEEILSVFTIEEISEYLANEY